MRIQDHKLAWRWINPLYAVLPSETLAQMHPVTPNDAKELHKLSLSFLVTDGLSPVLQPVTINSAEFSPEEVANWLRQQQPFLDQPVVLSWDSESAICTTWAVFVSFWPEFCYPASDDLVVFPESEAWVLFYHHEQAFHFGRCDVKA